MKESRDPSKCVWLNLHLNSLTIACFQVRTRRTITWTPWWTRHRAPSTSPCSSPCLARSSTAPTPKTSSRTPSAASMRRTRVCNADHVSHLMRSAFWWADFSHDQDRHFICAGVCLKFGTAGKIRKIASHIDPQTVCTYVHTPKQLANDCNRGIFLPPAVY